ncbi:hypothetical protein DOM21_12700 [Bacteriovorax stolpii]|uniref:ankyrin repeat domain-containing protein n=1 Tax=Bacteriovorax stolpii TaxID=960 RepID=UPI001159AF27|nr:ankyrin repeat domain-containing protein [Bacteriovorax stolpii]QDK42286.1 hypothetical protein DOM21_12700 [Bacteriovorax stolpii]
MINKKTILLKNYFDWVVSDLLLMIIGMIIISILFKIINFSETLQTTIIWGMLAYCVVSFWTLSLISSAKANSSSFSWKFFQSLPLSKKEIIFSLILSRLLLVVPIVLFLVLFKSNVDEFFKIFNNEDYNFFKLILNVVLFAVFIELIAVNGAITNPRLEYQKANANKDLISTIRILLLAITTILFLILGIGLLEIKYSVGVFDFLAPVLKEVFIFGANWSPLVLITFITFMYWNLLDTWTNEIKSYKKPIKWNPVKEWGTIIACSIFLGVFALNVDFATPTFYQGNRLGTSIYKKDYKQIERMPKGSVEINEASDSGVTPVLMAIAIGDLKMVKILVDKGADLNNVTNGKDKDYKYYDAMMFAVLSEQTDVVDYLLTKGFEVNSKPNQLNIYPLHLAAQSCKPKMLEHLIKLGADINAVNAKGESVSILAAKSKCLGNIVALHEAGADFSLKDNSGKTVNDYKSEKKHDQYLNHYIEKYSRKPASR